MELYKLTNETIDILSDKLGEMYESAGSAKKDTMRARLLLEEALLKYQHRLGEDVELYFRVYRIFGQRRFSIRLRAPEFDPFTLEENPMAFMLRSILSGFESGLPTWKYRNLENEIVFTVNRKAAIGSLARIVIAIVAALVCGIAARFIFPAGELSSFIENYVNPITNAYAGLFCIMAVLLTFLSIVISIVHIGDMAAVGALGGRIMRRFFIISGIAVIVLTLPILPLFDFSGNGAYNVAAKSLYDILIGFVPTNLVASFLDFNSIHIMIIGAMFGFSLLSMGQKGSAMSEIFDECSMVAGITNGFLNKFIFIYVALNLFSLITTSRFSQFASAGKMVIAIVIAEFILLIFYTVNACAKTKLPVGKFIKSVMPATLICLSSANLSTAFSTIIDMLMTSGIDDNTINLSLSLGSVFFQPACTVVFVFSSLFMATAYGVEISVAWLIVAIILSVILVGAMPNFPGASVSVIPLLYAQLGIPAEGVALMIAINAILQFLTVAIDAWCLQSEIFCLNAKYKNIIKE